MGSLPPLKNVWEVCKLKKQCGGQENSKKNKTPSHHMQAPASPSLTLTFPRCHQRKTSWAFSNMHTGKLFPTAGRQRILGFLDGNSSFEGKMLWRLPLQSASHLHRRHWHSHLLGIWPQSDCGRWCTSDHPTHRQSPPRAHCPAGTRGLHITQVSPTPRDSQESFLLVQRHNTNVQMSLLNIS